VSRASRAIARTLAQIADPTAAAVVVPDVPGLGAERMREVFALALDCAYSGGLEVPAEDALDLWALAASLQMPGVQARCEAAAPAALAAEGGLERALLYACGHAEAGARPARTPIKTLHLFFWGGREVHLVTHPTHGGRAGAALRSACAAHVLERLAPLRASGRLAALLAAHREALLAGASAALRPRLAALRPLTRRGSSMSMPGSCGASPRPPPGAPTAPRRLAVTLTTSRHGGVGAPHAHAAAVAPPEEQQPPCEARAAPAGLSGRRSRLRAEGAVQGLATMQPGPTAARPRAARARAGRCRRRACRCPRAAAARPACCRRRRARSNPRRSGPRAARPLACSWVLGAAPGCRSASSSVPPSVSGILRLCH